MGVVVSSQSALAPIILASTIIGFVSFAFTVATFLRVFWENVMTIFSAGTEVHNTLSNIRQEMLEERASLRALRRHMRRRQEKEREGVGTYGDRSKTGGLGSRDVFAGPELDEEVIRTLTDSLRHLIRRFSKIEAPFLEVGERSRRQDMAVGTTISRSRGKRRRRRSPRGDSVSPDRKADPYSSFDDEKRMPRRSRNVDVSGRDDPLHPSHDPGEMYCNVTLAKRIQWLRYRGAAMSLLQALSRLQTRRIARQVGEIATVMHDYSANFEEIRHNVAITVDKMNRVVGLRRVE